MSNKELLLTVIANLDEDDCSRLISDLEDEDIINISVAVIDYVKHEEHCKCINDSTRFDESFCDCGLYNVIKNHIDIHSKYYKRMCNEGE